MNNKNDIMKLLRDFKEIWYNKHKIIATSSRTCPNIDKVEWNKIDPNPTNMRKEYNILYFKYKFNSFWLTPKFNFPLLKISFSLL